MNAIREIIRREIATRGPMPFARFMELALYCPDSGYYEMKKDSTGHGGDFFTSVSVGKLFGQLLAFQFSRWLEELAASAGQNHPPLCLVEAGAHDGQLAVDILDWLNTFRPELAARIEYVIVEPSRRRQAWQRETLQKFDRVRWISQFDVSLRQRMPGFHGIIFSNELLDAFPVRRFGWDARAKQWFEWGVMFESDKFAWTRLENSELPSSLFPLPSSLLQVLPDGYAIETSSAAEDWWRAAANSLHRGKLVTIDYGLTEEEKFSPGRMRGTLRAYFRHHGADEVLANPGEQDLTAHVDFSAVQAAGESCGLATENLSTQAQFLTQILAHAVKAGFWEKLTSSEARQFQTLTHPEHLGRAFRVLTQAK